MQIIFKLYMNRNELRNFCYPSNLMYITDFFYFLNFTLTTWFFVTFSNTISHNNYDKYHLNLKLRMSKNVWNYYHMLLNFVSKITLSMLLIKKFQNSKNHCMIVIFSSFLKQEPKFIPNQFLMFISFFFLLNFY